jgi:hypothetical protein
LPYFKFRDAKTGEEKIEFMTMSERDNYLLENPHITQEIYGFPGSADPTRLGLKKPEGGFRDLLKHIKRHNRKSNINTW